MFFFIFKFFLVYKILSFDKETLSTIARRSTYGYTYADSNGQVIKVTKEPSLEVTTPPPPPSPTPTAATCTGGAIVDNSCFVPVETSCEEYCSKGNMTVHPYVANKFGTAKDVDEDANKLE